MIYSKTNHFENVDELVDSQFATREFFKTEGLRSDMLSNYKVILRKAKYHYKKEDYLEAFHFYGDAKKIAANIGWNDAEAYCLMEIGNLYLLWGKFEKAYKIFMECLNLVLNSDLSGVKSVLYFRLSEYYKKTNKPKLSKSYSEKAIHSIKKSILLV